MTRSGLEEALLALGLEDLIPLPEAASMPEVEALTSGSLDSLRDAFLELLESKRIQVWCGNWAEEPTVVSRERAIERLCNDQSYVFNSDEDLVERVYYANVENIHVGEA